MDLTTTKPKLKRPLPANRTYEQVLNHYLVEKALATKLKAANATERRAIFETMYDELFARVPDHPRLTRQHSDALTARANRYKLGLIAPFLGKSVRYLEFGAGDCRFAMQVASMVSMAYGADISDQRDPDREADPDNFKLIVYDGDTIDEPAPASIDLMFSDQLIEHFHPDDVRRHFELAKRVLKPGGRYVFRTPHAYTGPHDVSAYFCEEAEGFHLKEWTYTELRDLLNELGFSAMECYRLVKGRSVPVPFAYFRLVESLLRHAPRARLRATAQLLIPAIYAVAVK